MIGLKGVEMDSSEAKNASESEQTRYVSFFAIDQDIDASVDQMLKESYDKTFEGLKQVGETAEGLK